MVTFAQAQERAEEWINGDVPSYQHREVRVREFELGFVVWADRAEGPRSDGGAQRLVIARDSGEATLWPSLPVGEVIRRYEEEYGRPDVGRSAGSAPEACASASASAVSRGRREARRSCVTCGTTRPPRPGVARTAGCHPNRGLGLSR